MSSKVPDTLVPPAPDSPKMASAKTPAADGKPPLADRKRLYGGALYPETSFVRVTYLSTGSLSGERFMAGKHGEVPKAVFEKHFKPKRIAKLWEKPKLKPAAKRPSSDVGAFRRR